MVLMIKASMLLHAEASFPSIYMLKPCDLGAPAHPPQNQFMKNQYKGSYTLLFNQMVKFRPQKKSEEAYASPL